MRKLLRLNLYLTFLFCICIVSAKNNFADPAANEQRTNKAQDFDISYSIEPFYDINIFRFIVVLEFKGDKTGETKILLPNKYGGQNNLNGITEGFKFK